MSKPKSFAAVSDFKNVYKHKLYSASKLILDAELFYFRSNSLAQNPETRIFSDIGKLPIKAAEFSKIQTKIPRKGHRKKKIQGKILQNISAMLVT